jgi:hypothetical protein
LDAQARVRSFAPGRGQISMQESATKTTDQAVGAAKRLYACRICAHGNIPDSTFCSACGTPFPTSPCPQCGAANLVTMFSCGQCHAALAKRAAAEKPVSRRPLRLTTVVLGAVAAVVAILAILGYSAYEMVSFVYIPLDRKALPPEAGRVVEQRRGPGDAGRTIRRDGAAGNASAGAIDRKSAPPPIPASTTHVVPDGAARATATVPPAAGYQATEREAPRSGSCSREARVLGLCEDSGPGRK